MTTILKANCRKFSPNIFVQTKCQNCFRTKEVHSPDALQNCKVYNKEPIIQYYKGRRDNRDDAKYSTKLSTEIDNGYDVLTETTLHNIRINKRNGEMKLLNSARRDIYDKLSVDILSQESGKSAKLKSSIAELESISEQACQLTNELVCCRKELIELRRKIKGKNDINLHNGHNEHLNNTFAKKDEHCNSYLDYNEIRKRHNKDLEVIRKLGLELKEAQSNYDYLEIAYERLSKRIVEMEKMHESEINLMKDRINDLTCKLLTSERLLRLAKQKIAKYESKQERRRSSLKGKNQIQLPT